LTFIEKYGIIFIEIEREMIVDKFLSKFLFNACVGVRIT